MNIQADVSINGVALTNLIQAACSAIVDKKLASLQENGNGNSEGAYWMRFVDRRLLL